jgi:uncharacterized membrane protein
VARTPGPAHGLGLSLGQAGSAVHRTLIVAIGIAALVTVVGLVVLWPRGDGPMIDSELVGTPAELVDGTVAGADHVFCTGTDPEAKVFCNSVEVRLADGPEEGDIVVLELPSSPTTPALAAGDRIVLGYTPDAPEGQQYYFADYQRKVPLIWLGLIFVAAVLGLGRALGARALVGTAFSVVVLVVFVLPALLAGRNPLAVGLVGSAVVMLVSLYLAHGFTARTTTAVLGTFASLLLTGVLALVFVAATRLSGLGSEEAVYIKALAEQIDVRGLLLAGVVIGALGVLDDVTVTQASAVWELHHANPRFGVGALYRSALRIGRDHIASTVNTLVLAYAGASFPLLILFLQADRPLGDVLTGEVVAVEVVRTLVGSIGLVASVPITTALASLVVTRRRSAVGLSSDEGLRSG